MKTPPKDPSETAGGVPRTPPIFDDGIPKPGSSFERRDKATERSSMHLTGAAPSTYMNMMASDIPYHGSSEGIASARVPTIPPPRQHHHGTNPNPQVSAFPDQINAWFHQPQQINQPPPMDHLPYQPVPSQPRNGSPPRGQPGKGKGKFAASGGIDRALMAAADGDLVSKKIQAQQEELMKQQRILQQQIDQLQKLQDESSKGNPAVTAAAAAASAVIDEFEQLDELRASSPMSGPSISRPPGMDPPPDISVEKNLKI